MSFLIFRSILAYLAAFVVLANGGTMGPRAAICDGNARISGLTIALKAINDDSTAEINAIPLANNATLAFTVYGGPPVTTGPTQGLFRAELRLLSAVFFDLDVQNVTDDDVTTASAYGTAMLGIRATKTALLQTHFDGHAYYDYSCQIVNATIDIRIAQILRS